jgi:hypothetical protein
VTEPDAERPPIAVGAEGALAAVAGPDRRILAEIWATVDLERTLRTLRVGMDVVDDCQDPLLGARVAVIPPDPNRPRTAVAEPTTEGRLAATLARHGEGPAGRYIAVPDGLEAARARAAQMGVAFTRVEVGPFGPSILVLLSPVSGPHLILCEAAAVPSTP